MKKGRYPHFPECNSRGGAGSELTNEKSSNISAFAFSASSAVKNKESPTPSFISGGKDMYRKPLFVYAEWDEVARVWVATSDDVPGLATEGDNLEGLIEKLKVMIPELLDVNEAKGEREVPFELLTRRFEIAQRTSC